MTTTTSASQRRTVRTLAVVIATLIALAGGAMYKVAQHHKQPHFSAGGAFVNNGTGTRTGASPVPGSTTVPLTTTTTLPSATTSVPVAGANTATATTTTTAPNRPAPSTTLPAQVAAGLTPAADGTYTYSLTGTEGATGFGSRTFPSRMTINVHGATNVDANSEDVFDVVMSPNHKEREIVRWGSDGVSWTYEGGQVQFGPVTQSNQGTYSPAMLQVPALLVPGTVVTGASDALGSAGALERVEDWRVSVVGTQTLTIQGHPVPTVEVQVTRSTRPGATEDTTRTTTFWYSPAMRIWVQYAEVLHGAQSALGISFSYNAAFTATLVSYSAA